MLWKGSKTSKAFDQENIKLNDFNLLINKFSSRTWSGDISTGTKFKYFCELDGLRGPADIWTTGQDSKELDLMSGDIQDFQFRTRVRN